MVSPTPRPTPSPSSASALTPSEEAKAEAASVPTTTATTGKTGLTGVPIGTPVLKAQTTSPGPKGRLTRTRNVYAKTQYKSGDGMTVFATLGNQEKIDLLALLAQIPGLYSRKTAPTQEYLVRVSQSGVIPVRPEDAAALENVMRYADTVGDDYKTAVNYLVSNPNIAQGFFDISGTKAGKQREIALTPADALAVELEQSVLDYLDLKTSDKEKKAYAKRVNELEKKRGGALTSLERQQLLLDTVQDKARQVFKGDAESPDSLLMRRGALGGTYQLLKETYNDYGIELDDKTVYKQAINSIRSKQALENTLGKIRLQAEVVMPSLKTYIEQGLTPREALGSYISLKSKMYGIPENQIKITDLAPVYSGDKLMPYTEWQRYLYTLPEFKNTQLYQQQRLGDAQALIKNFIG